MPESTTMTLRLEATLKRRLEKLARFSKRSKSFLAAEAIREYIELNEWQIAEIEKGIREADAGEFAGEADAARLMKKWVTHAR